MEATRDRIVLSRSALLQRVLGAEGAWELHLKVDDPDDLHIIRIDPASWARLDDLRAYLEAP